jgi:hypothetical protein
MPNENANANASKKADTAKAEEAAKNEAAGQTAPVADEEERDLRKELSGTTPEGDGFQSPRAEDTKLTKPFTTPPDQNTVNPIANVDSVDPKTGYDPALPMEETGLRPSREDQDEDDFVDVAEGDRAKFLMDLYNNAKVRGWGAFSSTGDWTLEEAEFYLERLEAAPSKAGFGLNSNLYVGDIFGRRIRVDLGDSRVNLRKYNQANRSK